MRRRSGPLRRRTRTSVCFSCLAQTRGVARPLRKFWMNATAAHGSSRIHLACARRSEMKRAGLALLLIAAMPMHAADVKPLAHQIVKDAEDLATAPVRWRD